MQNSINSLILRIAHRDNEAFAELYHKMKKSVYFYALRFCGNHEIAEDVMQDTFITIWSQSGSFVSKGDGKSWILTIAKNKTLNIVKNNNRLCSLDEAENLYETEDTLFSLFESEFILGDLLRTLNEKEADIVMLRHAVGLTLTEIAKEKNMKKGTVFWTYNTAIKKLRNTYERMSFDEK